MRAGERAADWEGRIPDPERRVHGNSEQHVYVFLYISHVTEAHRLGSELCALLQRQWLDSVDAVEGVRPLFGEAAKELLLILSRANLKIRMEHIRCGLIRR